MSVVEGRKPRHVLSVVEPVTFVSRTVSVTVKAKVDTGAKRTSLDAGFAEALGVEPNGRTVRVRSANDDDPKRRPLVEVPLRVGGKEFRIEASLANRAKMSYPVIIGRDVLSEGGFRVRVREEVEAE